MEFSEVKKYIDTIKDSEKFKKLDDFTRMTRIKANKNMYENIEHYVSVYHPIRNIKEFFKPDYDYFMKFLQQYMGNKPAKIPVQEDGYVDLANTLYLVQPAMFSGNAGNFLDNYIMMTDGNIYISKLPLHYKGNSGVTNRYCLYTPLIASYIAKTLGVKCADISLAKSHNGYRIISKNFLNENEEIVTYMRNSEFISKYLKNMNEALKLRKFDEGEIEKAKFEFLKQEFIAKLIGLKDQTADNSPLIISTDEDEHKHVRMAPMFDLDYSFQIAKDFDYMIVRACDNGETDIGSLIEQYIDYPGFKEFVQSSIENLDIKKIFKQIYEDTGIEEFGRYVDYRPMTIFAEFVNKNIEIAKQTLSKLIENERDDR